MTDSTTAGPSVEQIIKLLLERKGLQSKPLTQARLIRDIYNGDVTLPLPEMDRNELPAVANNLQVGIEQFGMRIASVVPDVFYPPTRPGIKASEHKGDLRRRATLGWWQQNMMGRKMHRRGRWYGAYGSSPVFLRPDFKTGIARWEVRNPLDSYPAPSADPDSILPDDCIFAFRRSGAWLKASYPQQALRLMVAGKPVQDHHEVHIVEYADADVLVLAAYGDKPAEQWSQPEPGLMPYVELLRIPNRIGRTPVVAPGRVTLDRPHGQFDSMAGTYLAQAKLTALELIAVERGIFPDTYLVSNPGEQASFVAGPFEGRSGMVNVIQNGEIKTVSSDPSMLSAQIADRLERAGRVNGGIPAEMGGESQSNVRTGKRGDSIMSAVIDFHVQEAQETLALSLQEENKIAIAIAKQFFGNQRKQFYVSVGKAQGPVDYRANEIFENDNNTVSYPHPGTDANGLAIAIGSRIGTGIMSKRMGMEIDPMIPDAAAEDVRIKAEQLEQALMASLQQQAQGGMLPPADLARIVTLYNQQTMTLAEVVDKVHQEAQKRQATQVPAGAPAAQPGLANPGMGAEQPSIQPGPEGQANLSDIMQALASPARAARSNPVAA
jgi:hypothetical protein